MLLKQGNRKALRLLDKNTNKKKDNQFLEAKIQVRKDLLLSLKEEGVISPRILDAYCGSGVMWEKAYDSTSNYVGLDSKQWDDKRMTIVCDNRRYLRHCETDLNQFDIFDLDAYGSPAEALYLVCRKLSWQRTKTVGIVLTVGTGFNAKMNGTPIALLNYLSVSPHKHASVQQDHAENIIQMTILNMADEANAYPRKIKWVRTRSRNEMTYISYLLSQKQTSK